MSIEGPQPEVVVEALGVPVGIPVTGADADRLRHQWRRALTEQEAATVVRLDHLGIEHEVAHDYAVTTLVTMAALEATAGLRINLHAGAVADDRGRALAVIGPSGSGKTTAIGLLATRLGYLSDETVSIDESLRVHGHPKPLSVITDPEAPHLKKSMSPDDLGLLRPPADTRLHRIVLLHRGDDDSGLVPIAPAYAIAEMVEQTSSLVMLEHPILRLVEAIDACGGVWSLRYHEIGARLEELVGLLDREPRPEPARTHHPGRRPVAEPVAGAWRRAPWIDAVEFDDEIVLMAGDQVRVLAGPGVVAWLALETPATQDEVVVAITEVLGEHPDADRLVEDALRSMAEQGLVLAPDEVD